MYVVIDMDRLAVLHKHRDRSVLAKLWYIEGANGASKQFAADDHTTLETFTILELRLLYKHCTGTEPKGYFSGVVKCVADMLLRLPETDCNGFEVDRQAASIKETDKGCYKYVKGAFVPMLQPGLYDPPSLRVVPNDDELAWSFKSLPTAPKPPPAPFTAATLAYPPALPKTPRAAPPSGPPQGGQRALIWETADKMWDDAGKPVLKTAVLSLRKQIMDFLETEHAVKRNSSSNELGNWQKSRVV